MSGPRIMALIGVQIFPTVPISRGGSHASGDLWQFGCISLLASPTSEAQPCIEGFGALMRAFGAFYTKDIHLGF